jgi:hypothetical protein
MPAKRPEDSCIHFGAGAAVQLDLFFSALLTQCLRRARLVDAP